MCLAYAVGVKRSSLLHYPPEFFHPSDKIFCRFDARRKLRANDDLRRAEFPRCRHVFGNLLEGAGKIDPVFLDGSIVNLDAGADNKLDRVKKSGRSLFATIRGQTGLGSLIAAS
jgi:hypothetical protein